MGLGQPGPGFAYFLGASRETDHIQTRGLVDLFWKSCWHDFVSTLYTISIQLPDNAKSMSRRMRSRYQDIPKSSQILAAGKGFQSSEVGPQWFKTAPNRLPGAFGETDHIQTRGLVDSF